MLEEKAKKIASYIQNNSKLKSYLSNKSLGDEYRYNSLTLCVIDAVFSIGVNYKGVINVVNRYCNYFKIQKYRSDFNTYPPIEQQEKISDLLNRYATMGEESMRLNVYCNSQRTSTQNGITKAQAVYEFCKVLRKYDVEYFQDIPKISINDNFESDILKIPGQKSGVSLSYFFMLAGNDNLIKPDRMILRFIETSTGSNSTPQEATELIQRAAQLLSGQYPNMTPRLLDYVIWSYMSGR